MSRRGRRPKLGTLETRVLKRVWGLRRATVRDVLAAMTGRRKHAYTTILTTLRNLERKGYLRHEVEGRTHVYIPTVAEREVARSTVRDLVDRLFDGSPEQLFAALFRDEELTKQEFEELRRRILKVREQERDDE